MSTVLSQNFSLQFLDPNKGGRLESSTGRVASRDVIQFAPMKDVHGMCFSKTVFDAIQFMALEDKLFCFLVFPGTGISIVQSLLAEIPAQFMTYMRTREVQAIS